MAGIHWIVWLVVGAGVAISSRIIGGKLVLFFYVGLVFIAIGVFKLVAEYITRKKETKSESEELRSEFPAEPLSPKPL